MVAGMTGPPKTTSSMGKQSLGVQALAAGTEGLLGTEVLNVLLCTLTSDSGDQKQWPPGRSRWRLLTPTEHAWLQEQNQMQHLHNVFTSLRHEAHRTQVIAKSLVREDCSCVARFSAMPGAKPRCSGTLHWAATLPVHTD